MLPLGAVSDLRPISDRGKGLGEILHHYFKKTQQWLLFSVTESRNGHRLGRLQLIKDGGQKKKDRPWGNPKLLI